MKTQTDVSADKLRGGFYTPPSLVALALRRALSLSTDLPDKLHILEPTAGDGAFLRGIARSPFASRPHSITAVEIVGSEADKCHDYVSTSGLCAEVINEDFLSWESLNRRAFDVAIGNPPFVRFQFLDEGTKSHAKRIASSLGLPDKRVSNLWISVLLGAISSLRLGGAFAFVLPYECFTGTSARSVRAWLAHNSQQLTVDLFPPRSFPDVLQEVVVVSGRRCPLNYQRTTMTICDHGQSDRQWSHTVDPRIRTWTRYLLRPDQLGALDEARELSSVVSLGSVAKFEVSAVTGANSFFSVDNETTSIFELGRWTTPLLPRIRHAAGLIYTRREHDVLGESGSVCSLLDFSAKRPDPFNYSGARAYIVSGETKGFHRRYKTSIRHPWFRIPHIRPGQLMLSKRSHWYPRVVVNAADVVTTDTIYRGRITEDMISARDLVATFHNSLTLLTAEIEGRSFGGGVLELVPSEVSRLRLPKVPGLGVELNRLDNVARDGDPRSRGRIVAETNLLLVKEDVGLTADLLECLEQARRHLQSRRLDRNGQLSSVQSLMDRTA